MKLEVSWQVLEKHTNIEFIKILLVESELFHADGQTHDKRTDTQIDNEDNSRFPQFYDLPYNARTYSQVQVFLYNTKKQISVILAYDFRTNISIVRGSVISPFWFT